MRNWFTAVGIGFIAIAAHEPILGFMGCTYFLIQSVRKEST